MLALIVCVFVFVPSKSQPVARIQTFNPFAFLAHFNTWQYLACNGRWTEWAYKKNIAVHAECSVPLPNEIKYSICSLELALCIQSCSGQTGTHAYQRQAILFFVFKCRCTRTTCGTGIYSG